MKGGYCELPEWAYCPLEKPDIEDFSCKECHWYKAVEESKVDKQ